MHSAIMDIHVNKSCSLTFFRSKFEKLQFSGGFLFRLYIYKLNLQQVLGNKNKFKTA